MNGYILFIGVASGRVCAQPTKQTFLNKLYIIFEIVGTLGKDNLRHILGKEDIRPALAKSNIRHPLGKDDFRHLICKDILKHPLGKDDLKQLVGKDNLRHHITKEKLSHSLEKTHGQKFSWQRRSQASSQQFQVSSPMIL